MNYDRLRSLIYMKYLKTGLKKKKHCILWGLYLLTLLISVRPNQETMLTPR